MIILRTGLPGASKTLTAIAELCSNTEFHSVTHYYNNIKYFCLDLDAVGSFGSFLVHHYLKTNESLAVIQLLTSIHQRSEQPRVSDFPMLQNAYEIWLENFGHKKLYIEWCKKSFANNPNLPALLSFNAEFPSAPLTEFARFGLHFIHLEQPENWYNCSHPSIILIDECQRSFSPRPNGSRVPRHVSEFETHRHLGTDIHLITQDAKLLDSNIRRLAGRHIHLVNLFGSSRVRRMEHNEAFEPNDYHAAKLATKKIIGHPKNFYGVYLSSLKHTHKIKLPAKLFMLPLLLLVIGLLGFRLYSQFSNPTQVSTDPVVLEPVDSSSTDVIQLTEFKQPISGCERLTYAGMNFIKDKYIALFNCETANDITVKIQQGEEQDDFEYTYKESTIIDSEVLGLFGITTEVKSNYLFLIKGNKIYLAGSVF